MAKIDPIKMVRKSSKSSKSNSFKSSKSSESSISESVNAENISLDELSIKKGDFSIEDLNDNGENKDKYIKLKKILESSSTCQISDAFSGVSGRNGVIVGLKAMNRNKVYGRIVTAKTNCDDWGTSLLAMDQAKPGDVLFLYCYGERASVWGELASTSSQEKGIAGTVLYGYARDMDAIIDLDYPVYALDFCPNAGKPSALGEVNVNIEIDNQIIKPGDFIFGDESGVVVIPQEFFEDVIIATYNIKVKENNIIKQLKAGKTLSQIVGLDK